MKKEASTKKVNHMISSLSHTKKQLFTPLVLLPHQLGQMSPSSRSQVSCRFILGQYTYICTVEYTLNIIIGISIIVCLYIRCIE